MLVNYVSRVVAFESKVSKQGSAYNVVAFMDGTNVVRAVSRDKNLKITPFEEYELTLDLSFGAYPKIEVISCQQK